MSALIAKALVAEDSKIRCARHAGTWLVIQHQKVIARSRYPKPAFAIIRAALSKRAEQ